MRIKTIMLLATLTIGLTSAWGQGPNGSGTYYKTANSKTGAALKTALGNIINPHHNLGYDGLFAAYEKTDKREDGKVRDWYSNITNYNFGDHSSYKKEGDCYNREHTVPQSWFGSGVIKSDIVHVVPADGYVNNRRSNYPFAEVSNITWQSANNYSKLGSCRTNGYSGTVFEPNDEIKGDMARIYFYMVTCYESQAPSWAHNVFSSTRNGFEPWVVDMLMRWSKQDPVDAREIARNNAVYETQKNRNPYVDYPGLEDYIWGDKTTTPFSYDNYEGGASGEIIPVTAMPVFSPEEGTYYLQVEVSIASATEGADIYYTTDETIPTTDSKHYDGPFVLTESTTINAVAVKDGVSSYYATANYRITDVEEVPEDGLIALNDDFFGTSYAGSIKSSDKDDLTATQNGVTVVYSLASGSYRYCNDNQIRLYPGNELKFSVSQGKIVELGFEFATETPSTELNANGEPVVSNTWTGESSVVTVTFAGTSKHARLSGVTVKVTGSTDIDFTQDDVLKGKRVIYNLQGQRVLHPVKGVYIVDGKKVLIP